MKILTFLAVFILLVWLGWKLAQSPEKYLKKTSQSLIEMASITGSPSDMSLISKISKIKKFIHFDVQLKAEYEGQIFTANSLNELHSLLLAYFRQKSTGKVTYKNLSVKLKENKKQAVVSFIALFEKGKENISCNSFFEWIKEKRWYIKKIEVFPCVLTPVSP